MKNAIANIASGDQKQARDVIPSAGEYSLFGAEKNSKLRTNLDIYDFFLITGSLTPPRASTGTAGSNLDHAMAATLATMATKSVASM